MPHPTQEAQSEALWVRAEKQDQRRNMLAAFRLMLAAAKMGNTSAQINVGNYYDDAKGVKRNRTAALYWYKRAYRRGYSAAAYNIGVVWRNERNFKRALYWFSRAAQLGDPEANLDIAKHFLQNEKDAAKAIRYLKRIKPARWVSEAGLEEAAALLRQAKRQLRG